MQVYFKVFWNSIGLRVSKGRCNAFQFVSLLQTQLSTLQSTFLQLVTHQVAVTFLISRLDLITNINAHFTTDLHRSGIFLPHHLAG